MLIAISLVGDGEVEAAMRRAPAWGLTTVWIGSGLRPPPGVADHVLWVDEGDAAAHDGTFVRIYHLLWELSQVCLEHPGLMTESDGTESDGNDGSVCVTCSDEGRIGEVVDHDVHGFAKVRTADGIEEVETTLIGQVGPGDLVLIHAGTAVTMIEDG